MSSYRITVIYANHDRDSDCIPFPEQTISNDELQIFNVYENDPLQPHQNSLRAAQNAQGAYTIILDQGDEFSETFLESMEQALSASDAALVMPALSSKQINQKNGYFFISSEEDFSAPLTEDVTIFPTEIAGIMIKTDRLLPLLTRYLGTVEEEKRILLALLQLSSDFSYLASCTLTYGYPRECDYPYDLRCFDHTWYYSPFQNFLLPLMEEEQRKHGKIELPLQLLALYMLHCRLYSNVNNRNKRVIPPEDVPAYRDLFSDVLQYVDIQTILNNIAKPTKSTRTTKLLELRLKHRNFSYYPSLILEEDTFHLDCEGEVFCTLENLPVRINLIDFRNGCLEIDGAMYDFFSLDGCTIYACMDKERYPLIYNQRFSLTKCFGVTYARMKTFHVSVPVPPPTTKHILSFVFCVKGRSYPMQMAFPSHTSRYAKTFTYAYWKFGDYFSYWKQDKIHIIRARKWLTLYKELRLWQQIFKTKEGAYRQQLPLKMLNFILRPYFSKKKIWLFFDKIYKGGDSSEYLYKYAVKQNDDIQKYYLLDKDAPDYQRLRREGYRPLVRGSLKHRLIFLNANMVIASNSTVFAFNDYNFDRSLVIRGDVHFDVACVQHGLSIQKIALAQQRLRDNTKLYFCASKYEIENLSKPVYDYVGYDALKLTGVPRYDGLEDRHEKIILISPTWRMNSALPVTKNEGVARDYNPHFKETSYFQVYNSLINDPRLLKAAEQYGYRIHYVLHPIVSPQYEDFTQNKFVKIIPATSDMSYEKIFCESALMVTDFSGVQFDFAYMRKPVVYLHHNNIPQHYENGTFFYDTMGFGEICHTNEELIHVLCEYMKNDCKMPELYRNRADDFFAFSDHNNCQRIYSIMREYENNRER